MTELPPAQPLEAISATPDVGKPSPPLMQTRADGTIVIDLTQLVPPLAHECSEDTPNPLNTEIVVCARGATNQRLGPAIGPQDDGFGSAIPRARIKLSDTAAAEANVHNTPVGGFNANGGEVRLKIDF
ncbi:MAG: hypothetical protein GW858_07755 [Sphingomonadales bacterium]|nr:hypothetical protein [Sphingomonadales bacterium]NCQ20404.1 hypothetical protein [Sphingomonadales bacterium]NCT03012.1 hypothetical protein [Sphingomonadales bacterium]